MQQLYFSQPKKRYLFNSYLVLAVLFSMGLMFFVQFQVDNLQEKASKIDAKISAADDEIRVLEVEWVYLTRPERLRILSNKYSQNNSYTASNQIKDTAQLQRYYTASLEKAEAKSLAMASDKRNLN